MNRLAVVCCLLLAGAAGSAYAADWRVHAASSRLEFIATYERAAELGVFKEFDTRLHFDPASTGAIVPVIGTDVRVKFRIVPIETRASSVRQPD